MIFPDFLDDVSYSIHAAKMKMSDPSMVSKWENLQNQMRFKYLFASLYTVFLTSPSSTRPPFLQISCILAAPRWQPKYMRFVSTDVELDFGFMKVLFSSLNFAVYRAPHVPVV